MSKKRFGTAIPRLQQDYLNLKKDPVPYIRAAEPNPADMLEWHYVIEGGLFIHYNHILLKCLLFHANGRFLSIRQIDNVICFSIFQVQKIHPMLADTITEF